MVKDYCFVMFNWDNDCNKSVKLLESFVEAFHVAMVGDEPCKNVVYFLCRWNME